MGSNRTHNAGIVLNVATYIFLTKYIGVRTATWFIVTCGIQSFFTLIIGALIIVGFLYNFIGDMPVAKKCLMLLVKNLIILFMGQFI